MLYWKTDVFHMLPEPRLHVYTNPLSTAASAFRIEEPAAPMTAAAIVSKSQSWDHFALTVVAESNELEIKDPAFVLSYSADAHSVAPICLPI